MTASPQVVWSDLPAKGPDEKGRHLRPRDRCIRAIARAAATRSDAPRREFFDELIACPLRRHIAEPLLGRHGWIRHPQRADEEDRHLLPRHLIVGTVTIAAAARGDPAPGQFFDEAVAQS